MIVRGLTYKHLKLTENECKRLVEEREIVLIDTVQKVENLQNFVFDFSKNCAYFTGEVIEKIVFFDVVQQELLLENTLVPLKQNYFVGDFGTIIWNHKELMQTQDQIKSELKTRPNGFTRFEKLTHRTMHSKYL